jgi:hypothetical protein
MMLTQSFMQAFLSLGFGIDPTYVVPKQGNWFNVQDNMPEGAKVDTWCAYRITRTRGITNAYYDQLTDGTGNVLSKMMVSTIKVQLVGSEAEFGVQSMGMWSNREDVNNFLMVSGMALLPAGLGEYVVSDFKQDGSNTVLAFNAEFDITWLSEIVSNQQLLTSINLPSGINQVIVSGYLTINV